jgi:hypothetical protein
MKEGSLYQIVFFSIPEDPQGVVPKLNLSLTPPVAKRERLLKHSISEWIERSFLNVSLFTKYPPQAHAWGRCLVSVLRIRE